MRLADMERKVKEAHVIEQLHKLNFYNTDGLEYEDLIQKLATERAKRE